MRSRLLFATAALLAVTAGPALAQSGQQPSEPRRDGGLHVCCGGSVGYVGGGSGTISGHVRGPGGPGAGRTPATEPVVADPDVLNDGKVTPARVPAVGDRRIDAKKTSASWELPALLAAMAILGGASLLVGYRRRPFDVA